MNSFERFSEDKLPYECKFVNSLKDECISKKDYLHTINVWNTLERKTIGNYHDLYLKTDVSLFAVFEAY